MNREKIIKALKCCSQQNCSDCPFLKPNPDCLKTLPENAISLINTLIWEKEKLNHLIEVLNQNNSELEIELSQTYDRLEEAKSNTAQKIQTKFNEEIGTNFLYNGWYLKQTIMPRVVKEILEERIDIE
jgi:DUF438 domain-containing protein